MKQILYQLVFLLLYCSPSYANSIKQAAIDLELHEHPYWFRLLHFEDKKSLITNEDFFLSPDGHINPKQELLETLSQFINNPQTICQYPARYKWLKEKLYLKIQKPHCEELNTFLKPNFKKISVIYTSERYNAPASIFGHTMLKVESGTIPYVINYVAKVPDNENSFVYAYRGINGKYKSQYNLISYNIKDYEYTAQEFRDLINFELTFNNDEIENIMLHLFEVRHTVQDYYFFSRNCSSEILKLLDLAREDLALGEQLHKPTIPAEIVSLLENNHLVSKITRKISKLKQFYIYINMLNSNEKDFFLKIIKNKYSVAKFFKNKNLSLEAKKKIILASILFFEIKSIQGGFEPKNMYPLLKLVRLMVKHGIELEPGESILKQNPISNRFHRVSIGSDFNRSNHVKYFTFGYRYLYRHRFDLISNTSKKGSVELLDVSLRTVNSDLTVNYLVLVNIESMPTSTEFFSETTNKIVFGFKRLFFYDEFYGYFDYGLGYSYELTSNINFNFYLKGGAYYKYGDAMLLAGFEPSFEYKFKNKYICELKYEINRYTNTIQEQNIFINNHFKISKSTTLNLSLSQKNDLKSYNTISLRYNFNF